MSKARSALFVAVITSALWHGEHSAGQDPRPNIVFIMADDMGWGDLGSFGNTVLQTDFLDQLADEGLKWREW